MSKRKESNTKIRNFILENIPQYPSTITRLTSEQFGITRQAAFYHVNKLMDEGVIVGKGSTRSRQYELVPISEEAYSTAISVDLQEDTLWRECLLPTFREIKSNVVEICQYGFTEMLNNVVDHSEGSEVAFYISRTPVLIQMWVLDDGIGIFNKIQNELGLESRRQAILELAKGKLTTDPEQHTGEGIFFASRVFDNFIIISEDLYFSHTEPSNDWLIKNRGIRGTAVEMKIHPNSERTLREVFEWHTTDQEDFGFTRTSIPVELAKFGDENLISRSQAKRLLARFDRFKEIMLDFQGIETIGQSFADEIFRVFKLNHPDVNIIWINANEYIEWMIRRALSNH